ncbi:MAG TPA: hypothetical protein PK597_03655 [Oscillospiraceae bacterium]|nr:hypothetical protein [Oscillospiraceae bacterium]
MTALWILGILLLLFVAFLLLRVGVSASYDEDGARADARLGPVRFRLYPPKEKKKPPEERPKPKRPEAEAEEKKKGGALENLRPLLGPLFDALGKLRRRLRVDRLSIDFTAASDDPSRAAMEFGYASAGLGTLLALLENTLDIRERDIRTQVDFTRETPLIRAAAALSVRIGTLLAIALPLAVTYWKNRKKQAAEKQGGKDHGK